LSSLVKAPEVHFIHFGDSSLDFVLYVWIYEAREQHSILSDLHFMIDQKFRARNIEIPFHNEMSGWFLPMQSKAAS